MATYSIIDNIRPRLGLPKIGVNYDTSQDDVIGIHQADVDNIVNSKLRQKLGRHDKDGRLLVVPLATSGSKVRITNPKSEFHELEIETVTGLGKITVVKKISDVSLPPRTFEPYVSPPASYRSISAKDNSDANQRLDALDGFEVGAVIALIKPAGQTVSVQHNSSIDSRFMTISLAAVSLSENAPIYFEKRSDANGGSWYELAALSTSGGFNTVTIPSDAYLQKIAEDLVIASYRKDTAENSDKYDQELRRLDGYLDQRFGITINIGIDPTSISEGSA